MTIESGNLGSLSGTTDQQSYQAQPKKAHGFDDGPRSLLGLYRWAFFGLVAYAIAEALLTLVSVFLIWLYLPSTVVPFTQAELGSIDIAIGILGLAQMALFWFCVIIVGRMTFRAMKNLYTVDSSFPEMSPRWAVGWYFIPFANLWQPARGMSQIYHGSHHAAGEAVPSEGRIAAWWTCWLATNITANISMRLSGGFTNMTPGIPSFSFDAASAIFGTLSAVFLLRLLKPISEKQELLKHGGAARVFD